MDFQLTTGRTVHGRLEIERIGPQWIQSTLSCIGYPLGHLGQRPAEQLNYYTSLVPGRGMYSRFFQLLGEKEQLSYHCHDECQDIHCLARSG